MNSKHIVYSTPTKTWINEFFDSMYKPSRDAIINDLVNYRLDLAGFTSLSSNVKRIKYFESWNLVYEQYKTEKLEKIHKDLFPERWV